MRHNRLRLCALFLLGLGLAGLHAQTSVNTAGGNASGSGGSASYSIGQVVYTTNTATSGSLAQGVQQPYEISVVTSIDDAKDINLSVSAYPNPTYDNLTLELTGIDIIDLCFQLYDLKGYLLQNEKITTVQTFILMDNLLPANYFLKIVKGNVEIKVFKITKVN